MSTRDAEDLDGRSAPVASPGARASVAPSHEVNRKTGHDSVLVELNALLGRGSHYQGKLYFEGQVRLEGRFEGSIRGDGILVIAEGAEVDADVEVATCILVGGTLRGNVRAAEAIELHVPSVVTGDLHAPNVFIDRGVQFQGSCRMAPLDEPPSAPLPSADPSSDG
ncbi:MAG: polymer-forming cytoskeletal protein [Deltaproteobacteria bacterium]|nr:polymer-forming cytoskeletal protein [Deltaproteobacteria bacterium]